MQFEIVTIFPEFFSSIFENGILRRALADGLVTVGVHDLRAFTHDRHRTVDDRPFGGGEGMVLKPEPLAEALEALGIAPKADRAATIQRTVERPDSEGGGGFNPRIEPTQPAGILQAAEDFNRSQALYQGTTSVVPESPQNERGALAPEGSLSENPPPLPRTRVILLSAQGRPFTQSLARELAGLERVVLICGRY